MCRIAAYVGPPIPLERIIIRPQHSLLAQSQHAQEAKLSVNGDGFGVAWYGDDDSEPGLYRDVLPAWSDGNLVSLCRMIRSRLFLGHVRASTMGETSRSNCHPFVSARWSFCHNGNVPHFPQIRRQLEADLPDALYQQRRGSTDSEMLFLTLLAAGLAQDPHAAIQRTIERFLDGAGSAPVRLTCVFADGEALWGFRFATDAKPPSLYVSDTLDGGGRSLASEPRCATPQRWSMVPPDSLVRVSAGGVHHSPIWDQIAVNQ